MTRRLSYTLACTLLGLALGCVPAFLHGPTHEKWDYFHLDGTKIVAGWYFARMSIGLLVGITTVPAAWWLRGPLCGVLAMLPLGVVALGNPLCGPP
ncbi:MAG: hypothetical protein HY899_07255 [Deltaproteobacteria bacterium]|nr:hypothetical protein [Deltaproteobacteria bacterium]